MTAREMARAWEKRALAARPTLRAEMRGLGELALRVSLQLVREEIYSKPEDRTRSGGFKWRRTNRLAVNERLMLGPDGLSAVIVNRVEYAEPRHEANKPGRRQINPLRTAHWRDDMVRIVWPVWQERFRRWNVILMRIK